MLLKPAFEPLIPGDRVEVVAPGYGVSSDIIQKVETFLQNWGLIAHIQPHWQIGSNLLYAASDEHRLESLKAALLSSQAKAIWILRGGAGITRLVPKLLTWAHALPSPPTYKIFIGLSDVTALHLLLAQEWGWPTLHAPTLRGSVNHSFSQESIHLLKDVLFGHKPILEETDLLPLNELARQEGSIQASLVGGNHSIVQYSIGTAWQVDSRYKILFLEDIDEQPYRIDLRLEHLFQSRALEWVKAIILSDFNFASVKPEENCDEKMAYVFQKFSQKMTIPVFQMPGYGHKFLSKPLLMGAPVLLKLGKFPSLQMNFTAKL